MTETSKGRLYAAPRIMSFVFGVLCAGLSSGGEPILLKAGTIHPESDGALQTVRTKFVTQKTGSEDDRGLYIIQSKSRITPVWRSSLVKTGARILRYIPENAYLIEATEGVIASIRENVKSAYLGEYLPEYRLSQTLAGFAKKKESASAVEVKATSNRKDSCVCSVCLFSRDSLTDVVRRVKALPGCRVLAADGAVVRCELTESGMAELTALPDVEWIEEYHQPAIKNKDVIKDSMMNVETVWPGGDTGLGLTGKGQVVAAYPACIRPMNRVYYRASRNCGLIRSGETTRFLKPNGSPWGERALACLPFPLPTNLRYTLWSASLDG